ncbi:MAG: hypothetical protein IKS43_05550 [Clostridia bacterium]|nr:hypothetical protein [Clostridia bacterium]
MNRKCFFCNSEQSEAADVLGGSTIVNCPNCGRFVYTSSLESNNRLYSRRDRIASFLFYNKTDKNNRPIAGFFFGDEEEYNEYADAHLRFVSQNEVDNWYPRTFNDKITRILLVLAQRTNVLGATIELTNEEKMACFFIERYRADNRSLLDHKVIYSQVDFLKDYMTKNELISNVAFSSDGRMTCRLAPKGWQRVDELQKDNSRLMQKQVFVAMSFKPEMDPVRAAIKKAIIGCGYEPRIMDEIEHNHQIVPEMLYEIRQARFVIAELTGHNNGAYYEAGYALGLGKDVIHVCKSEQFGTDGHFDVKQVNTVLWDNETELAEKLAKRIKATIE